MDEQMVYHSFSMTVSEGKRLIGKGVAALVSGDDQLSETKLKTALAFHLVPEDGSCPLSSALKK